MGLGGHAVAEMGMNTGQVGAQVAGLGASFQNEVKVSQSFG